jgi:hypothetical protein
MIEITFISIFNNVSNKNSIVSLIKTPDGVTGRTKRPRGRELGGGGMALTGSHQTPIKLT